MLNTSLKWGIYSDDTKSLSCNFIYKCWFCDTPIFRLNAVAYICHVPINEYSIFILILTVDDTEMKALMIGLVWRSVVLLGFEYSHAVSVTKFGKLCTCRSSSSSWEYLFVSCTIIGILEPILLGT